MYRLKAYLKFLLTATNQHGIHSPFVYGYVTKCLYTKPKLCHNTTLNVLLKSIPYFRAERIKFLSKNDIFKNKIHQKYSSVIFGQNPYDILFVSAPYLQELNIILSEQKEIHNDLLVLIDGIYWTKDNKLAWDNLIKNKKITITIDMFHCGAVFFRKRQAKENFKIRI